MKQNTQKIIGGFALTAITLLVGCGKSNNMAQLIVLEDLHNPGQPLISAPKVEQQIVYEQVQVPTNSTQVDQLAALRGKELRTPIYGPISNKPAHEAWEAKNAKCKELLKSLNDPEAAKCLNAGKEPPKMVRGIIRYETIVLPAAPAEMTGTETVIQQKIVTVTNEGSEIVVGFVKEGDFFNGDAFTTVTSKEYNTIQKNPDGALVPKTTTQGKSGLDVAGAVIGVVRDAAVLGTAVKLLTGPGVTGQSNDTNVTVTQEQKMGIVNRPTTIINNKKHGGHDCD